MKSNVWSKGNLALMGLDDGVEEVNRPKTIELMRVDSVVLKFLKQKKCECNNPSDKMTRIGDTETYQDYCQDCKCLIATGQIGETTKRIIKTFL
jgi:hypothetical protein